VLGVPAASAATTAALSLAGVVLAAVALFAFRRQLRALAVEERLVAAAAALSLLALPWIGWRFVEDLRTTTKLGSYERANMGPIQAYLPGYLVDGARGHVHGSWTPVVAAAPNEVARKAFPSLVLTTLFPLPSAPPAKAAWIVGWGTPDAVGRNAIVVHARQGPLPPVVVARTRR
jgi:hypothetical protein